MAVPFTPSLGDIVQLCKFTWDVCAKLKRAPRELEYLYAECSTFHRVLTQVDQQARNPFSPYNLMFEGPEFIHRALLNYQETLKMLQDKLVQFEARTLMDRAKFIVTDFEEPMRRLRSHREDISMNLQIGTNNALGKLLEIVSQLAVDIREGRRSTILISEDPNWHEDTRTLVEEELQRSARNIPSDEIERHRPDVERYVQILSELRGFEEPRPDIAPGDSVSVLESKVDGPAAHSPTHSISLDTGWPYYRRIPIYNISYGTIFNPSVNTSGIPKPETCDIWGLVSVCWQLQTVCAQKLMDVTESQNEIDREVLRYLSDRLAKFAPILLLCLARSSTDKRFWTKLTQRDSAVSAGRLLMQYLKAMKTEIERRSTLQQNPTLNSSQQISPPRRSGLKRLLRPRSNPSLYVTPSEPKLDFGTEWCSQIDLFAGALRGELERDMRSWHQFRSIREAAISDQEFRNGIGDANEHWSRAYETALGRAGGITYPSELNEDGGQLLMNWLLAAQGLDSRESSTSGLELLMDNLTLVQLTVDKVNSPVLPQTTNRPSYNAAATSYSSGTEMSGPYPSVALWQPPPQVFSQPLQNPFILPELSTSSLAGVDTGSSFGTQPQNPFGFSSPITPTPSLSMPNVVDATTPAQQQTLPALNIVLTSPEGYSSQPEEAGGGGTVQTGPIGPGVAPSYPESTGHGAGVPGPGGVIRPGPSSHSANVAPSDDHDHEEGETFFDADEFPGRE